MSAYRDLEDKMEDITRIIGDMEDILPNMEAYARENQPCSVTCDDCGAELTFETEVDSDNDIWVTVKPCDCVVERLRPQVDCAKCGTEMFADITTKLW